jgi:hypothetical protein
MHNVEITGATRLYRVESALTVGLALSWEDDAPFVPRLAVR